MNDSRCLFVKLPLGDIIHTGASEVVFAESQLYHYLLVILKDNINIFIVSYSYKFTQLWVIGHGVVS